MTYKNFPLKECDKELQRIKRECPNMAFYQKWTCGGCHKRITGNTPNALFVQGICEECGHTTDLRKTGCNYAVHMVIGGKGVPS